MTAAVFPRQNRDLDYKGNYKNIQWVMLISGILTPANMAKDLGHAAPVPINMVLSASFIFRQCFKYDAHDIGFKKLD
ncbi:unnamed protein product [Leptidea sinapis]|uniref:Uncharacterized protein n=1 Tax=Leptidea sinapis TaxID=189913 RepID=A0A5E4QK39_9NEOP|nr:unnamed protein product [Leptidea sinapis]